MNVRLTLRSLVCSISLCLLLVCGFVQDASAAACYATFSRADFPNCDKLSDSYALHWKVKDGNVTFAIDVDEASTGWAGLGVSQAGGMRGADIWIVHRTQAGDGWAVWDMHSEDSVTPSMDASQDVTLVGTPMTTSNSIKAVITRKLKACDAGDLSIPPNRTLPFIWSHNHEDVYHGPVNRGTWMLRLEPTATTPSAAADATTESLSLLMPNIPVPENMTSYLCVNFRMPADVKRHIVEISFNVASPDLVHHIALHRCTSLPSVGLGKLFPCMDTIIPAECEGFTAVWVPGTETWKSPVEAGFPMPAYYMVQVHYNNVKNLAGLVDSSGVILKHTAKLRKHDLATLAVTSADIYIPPGEPVIITPAAVCPAECTSKFTEPITVVSHLHHMHTLGRTIRTQHVRGGRELIPLAVRDRWDFNWQIVDAPNQGAAVIQPGDALITTCQYNSTMKSTVTKFGFSTDEEMCVDFITYYPAQNLDSCVPMAPGFVHCGAPGRFTTWLRETVANATKAAAGNATAIPAGSQVQPANQQAPAPAGGAVPDGGIVASGTVPDPAAMTALFEMAAAQGLLQKYNTSEYVAGGYIPYVPEDGCPAFLSQSAVAEGPVGPAANATKSRSGAGQGVGMHAMMLVLLGSVALISSSMLHV